MRDRPPPPWDRRRHGESVRRPRAGKRHRPHVAEAEGAIPFEARAQAEATRRALTVSVGAGGDPPAALLLLEDGDDAGAGLGSRQDVDCRGGRGLPVDLGDTLLEIAQLQDSALDTGKGRLRRDPRRFDGLLALPLARVNEALDPAFDRDEAERAGFQILRGHVDLRRDQPSVGVGLPQVVNQPFDLALPHAGSATRLRDRVGRTAGQRRHAVDDDGRDREADGTRADRLRTDVDVRTARCGLEAAEVVGLLTFSQQIEARVDACLPQGRSGTHQDDRGEKKPLHRAVPRRMPTSERVSRPAPAGTAIISGVVGQTGSTADDGTTPSKRM